MKIQVIAHPHAKQSKVKKDQAGKIHVYTQAPAQDNQANLAIIKALADFFQVKKSQIFLDSGAKSKLKTFTVFL